MTINEAAVQLLTHFSEEEREIPDNVTYPGRNDAVRLAMNMAMQEIFGDSSPWIRFDERGHQVFAATSVTVAVADGSTSATITGWASWMAGCSIVIEGHDIDNQIRTASASATLKYPYVGTGGSKSATVYHDSITIGDDVLEVVAPVRWNQQILEPSPSIDGGRFRSGDRDYGFHRHIVPGLSSPRVANSLGTPVRYSIESWSASATTQPQTRLKLDPASAEVGILDYRAKLAPPAITTLQSNDDLPIPFQFVESIFFPVARKHLVGSPFWRFGPELSAVQSAYDMAMRLLGSLNPRKDAGMRIRPIY